MRVTAQVRLQDFRRISTHGTRGHWLEKWSLVSQIFPAISKSAGEERGVTRWVDERLCFERDRRTDQPAYQNVVELVSVEKELLKPAKVHGRESSSAQFADSGFADNRKSWIQKMALMENCNYKYAKRLTV